MYTKRQATTAEVRKHYKERGLNVRISHDGHVEYKDSQEGPWLEGRWIEEHRISDAYGVCTV